MKLKKDERGFRTILQRGATSQGFHVVKIPDNPGKFKVKAIYDLGLVRDGVYHAIELKEMVPPQWGVKMSAIEDHQIENLLDARAKGAFAWLITRFRLMPGPSRMAEYGNRMIREVWAVTIDQVMAARNIEQRDGLSLNWHRTHGIALPRFQVDVTSKTGEKRREPAYDPEPMHLLALQSRA